MSPPRPCRKRQLEFSDHGRGCPGCSCRCLDIGCSNAWKKVNAWVAMDTTLFCVLRPHRFASALIQDSGLHCSLPGRSEGAASEGDYELGRSERPGWGERTSYLWACPTVVGGAHTDQCDSGSAWRLSSICTTLSRPVAGMPNHSLAKHIRRRRLAFSDSSSRPRWPQTTGPVIERWIRRWAGSPHKGPGGPGRPANQLPELPCSLGSALAAPSQSFDGALTAYSSAARQTHLLI